jgi:hypothetical protein
VNRFMSVLAPSPMNGGVMWGPDGRVEALGPT